MLVCVAMDFPRLRFLHGVRDKILGMNLLPLPQDSPWWGCVVVRSFP